MAERPRRGLTPLDIFITVISSVAFGLFRGVLAIKRRDYVICPTVTQEERAHLQRHI